MYILDRRFFMTQCKTSAAISFRVWIGKKLWFWIHYLFMPHYLSSSAAKIPGILLFVYFSNQALVVLKCLNQSYHQQPCVPDHYNLGTTPFLIFFNLWESLSDRFLVYDFFVSRGFCWHFRLCLCLSSVVKCDKLRQ